MARCSRCARENAAGAVACAACGTPLPAPPPVSRAPFPPRPSNVSTPRAPGLAPAPVPPPGPSATLRCTACGVAIPPGFKFCGACGTPVVAPAVRAAPPPPSASVPGPLGVRRSTAVRARVVILGPDGTVLATHPLTSENTSVGAAGDLRLTDPFCAPVQGRLVFRGHLLSFVPEKSTNGAFLLIKRDTELRVGREFRTGRQLLRLEPFRVRPPASEPLWGSPNPGYRVQVQQILAGGVDGDVFPLHEGENLIGRSAGDLSFPGDGYVSSRHANLTVRGEQVVLSDVGSSNGTFVRVEQETNIDPGDLLLIGEQLLRVDPP